MANCVTNICTKNYQNLIIGFQATVKIVGDVFLRHSVLVVIAARVVVIVVVVVVEVV